MNYTLENLKSLKIVGQAFDSVIIAYSETHKTLVVIDQHAIHERIRLEYYIQCNNILAKPLKFNPDIIEIKKKSGMVNTFAKFVSTAEKYLSKNDTQILDKKKDNINKSPTDEFLKEKACKGAIKFNNRLNDEIIKHLIENVSYCNFPFICAHGRKSIFGIIKLN